MWILCGAVPGHGSIRCHPMKGRALRTKKNGARRSDVIKINFITGARCQPPAKSLLWTRALEDGRICLSNNAAERALRGIALGRGAHTM